MAIGVVLIVLLGAGVWLWATAGRETTDDAQVDAHVTPVATRVGGMVVDVPVKENQQIDAGATLKFNRSSNKSFFDIISGGGGITIAALARKMIVLDPNPNHAAPLSSTSSTT